MSQLAKAVMAVDLGDRKIINDKSFSPLFKDVFSSKAAIEEQVGYFAATKYKIAVTIGIESHAKDQKELEDRIIKAKRSIIEVVFGEFRQDLLRINNAVYDRDFAVARDLLTSLERKMFGEF